MLKNYFYMLIYNIIIILAPLVVTPYLSRTLGVDNLGTYGYCNAVMMLFVYLSCTGISLYGKREVSVARIKKDKLSRVFSEIFVLQLIQHLILAVLYIFVIQFMPEYKHLLIIGILGPVSSLFNVYWFFSGMEYFKVVSFANILTKILMVAGIFVFVKNEQDLGKYMLVMLGSYCITNLFGFIYSIRYVKLEKVSINRVVEHAKPAFLLFLPSIVLSLYAAIDNVMLGQFSTMTETGYYGQSEKIINILLVFITSIGVVVMPSLAVSDEQGNQQELLQRVKNAISVVCLLSCPFTAGIIAISGSFVPWFWGEGFLPLIKLLPLFAPMLLLEGLCDIVGTQLLIAVHRDRFLMTVNIVFLVADIFLNALLIPEKGARGALIATIVAVLLKLFLILFNLKNKDIVKACGISVLKYGLYSVVMFIITYSAYRFFLYEASIINSMLLVCIGGIIYLLLLAVSHDPWIKYVKDKML